MNKVQRIWLGILSFSPLIITTIITVLILKNFVGLFGLALADAPAEEAGMYILKDYIVIFIFSVISGILNILQLIIFLILIIKNNRLDNNNKILYVVFLIFFNQITAIIYFLLEVAGKKGRSELDEINV